MENTQAFREDFHQMIGMVKGDSWETVKDIPGKRPLAFCFIDADHGIDGFPKDILPWTAKVKPGGIVVFHDYGVWKPSVVVKRYVDAWQSLVNWELIGQVRSAIAFRRPETHAERVKRFGGTFREQYG